MKNKNFELVVELSRALEYALVDFVVNGNSEYKRVGETNFYIQMNHEDYTLSELIDNEQEVVVKFPSKYYAIDTACKMLDYIK